MNIAAAGYRTLLDALEAAPSDRLFVLEWHDADDHHSVTFGDFRRLANQHACFLKQQGVRCGDRVVFVMPQGIALMAAFIGSMSLGALPAILAYPNSRVEPTKYSSGLRGVTANLKAPFVVVDENFPAELVANLTGAGSTTIIRSLTSTESLGAIEQADLSIHPESLAFIQHSAGTTGLQKGVALTHTAVLRQLSHLVEALNVNGNDCLYSWLPLYHDMGLVACFMLPMVCHLPVIMQAPTEWVQRPETMLKLIHDRRCTLAWMPNFAFQFVPRRTSAESKSAYDLSSLRALINCSEPVKTESMDEFYKAFASQGLKREALQSSYAMAENVFAVTQSERKGPLKIFADRQHFRSQHLIKEVGADITGSISFTSSGRLMPQNYMRIVSDGGETLSPRQVGEIFVKSDSLFEGYYNRSDLTALSMIDGWYRTGDLGFFHEEELFVVGRKKDVLILAGENIYPQDVEDTVCGHPSIHDGRAVAIGLFNPDTGTEDLVVVAEVEQHELLEDKAQIEREIRASIFSQIGIAVRLLLLKPPGWIVKSTAGKPSRSTTREKLLREYPSLQHRE
jgi:fatty-acyl-CoA synthase